MSMLTQECTVAEMIADIIDGQRLLTLEDAVDEYLLAERDILTEATTAADKMVDLHIDAGFDDESQYLEDDEEVNAILDAEITEEIDGEEDLFQDTTDGIEEDEDYVDDIEDVLCPYEDLEAMIADEDSAYVDQLISDQLLGL
jgi:hypothetical protein